MIKNNKIRLLIISFVMCFFVGINVSAKNKLFSCKYDVIINPEVTGVFSSKAITFPLDVSVYDDKTSEFRNFELNLNRAFKQVYFSANERSTYYIGLDETNFYKYSVKSNLYSCPPLTLVRDSSNPAYYTLLFYDAGNSDGINGDYKYVTSSVQPVVENNDDNDKVVKETSSCTPFVYNGEELGGNDFKLKLKAYSDGTKKVCISMDNLSDSCGNVNLGSDLTITYAGNSNIYHYTIETNQLSKFFIQNNSGQNTFNCPSKVYMAKVNSLPITYILTTSKQDAEDLSNRFSELTPDIPGGSDVGDEPKADVCETIPDIIVDYIKQALKLIRWAGLVLMIVLGTLDFVKAAAADDQDAMKKASQNFIKRLIAVIILFLLPIIIELILSILSIIGFDFAKCIHIVDF